MRSRGCRAILRVAAALLAAMAFASGCNWLSGPNLDSDPNTPTSATRDELLTGVQAFQSGFQGSFEPGSIDQQLDASIWMQQMAAVGRGDLNDYHFIPIGSWTRAYAQGGLVDLRKIQASARHDSDRIYLGVAQIWEAIVIGQTADEFGDIPYSEAVSDVAAPKLDAQATVYDALQRLLDSAIANLISGRGPGPPPAIDLIYQNNDTKWIEAAHSLKARLFLHMAERDPAAYGKALSEAERGISSADGDFLTWHSDTPGEWNPWYYLSVNGDFHTDVTVAATVVDIMKSRNDPRLPIYFTLAGNGTYAGASPGDGFNSHTQSEINSTRGAKSFRQPILTWAETRLIEAEALYRAGREGDALAALNAERIAATLPPINTSGPELLVQILQEKYVALFESPEIWNDYKRTCYPNLAPVSQVLGGNIPARYYWPQEGNPNIPTQQPSRNWNDPVTPYAPDGTPCLGQRS